MNKIVEEAARAFVKVVETYKSNKLKTLYICIFFDIKTVFTYKEELKYIKQSVGVYNEEKI